MNPEGPSPMAPEPQPVAEFGPEVHPRTLAEMREHLARLERLLDPQHRLTTAAGKPWVPAWRRVTAGEARWPVSWPGSIFRTRDIASCAPPVRSHPWVRSPPPGCTGGGAPASPPSTTPCLPPSGCTWPKPDPRYSTSSPTATPNGSPARYTAPAQAATRHTSLPPDILKHAATAPKIEHGRREGSFVQSAPHGGDQCSLHPDIACVEMQPSFIKRGP